MATAKVVAVIKTLAVLFRIRGPTPSAIPPSTTPAPLAPDKETRLPKKKALLIGITYEKRRADNLAVGASPGETVHETVKPDEPAPNEPMPQHEEGAALFGPHADCCEMKKVLIDIYGYKEDEIVLLLDDGIHPEPTREKIIDELQKLVSDAQPGDHFCFLYSGHSAQERGRIGSQPDGMGEAIIAADDDGSWTVVVPDNELRQYLVDPLPVGATLVAIFDSSHSATMLDLGHCWCNQIWMPWNASSTSNDVRPRRRDAEYRTLPGHFKVYASTLPPSNESSPTHERVTRQFTIDIAAGSPKTPGTVERAGRMTRTTMDGGEARTQRTGTLEQAPTLVEDKEFTFEDLANDLDMVLMEEPEDSWHEAQCDGMCRQRAEAAKDGAAPAANIIQLAAQDGSWSWGEKSMTRALINVLREDPKQPLWKVLQDVSQEVYKTTQAARSHYKKTADDTEWVTHMSAQDLRLASDVPLDMQTPLPLSDFDPSVVA